MAEGLEAAYHVPQQSRREKLRDPRLLYDIPPPIPSDFQIDPSTLHILNNTPFFNNQLQPQPLSLSLPPNDDVVSSSSSSSLLLPPPPSYAAASFLKASRFLVPAQQLLDDLCHVGQPRVTHAPDHFDTTSFIEPPSSSSPETFASGDASQGCWKKSRLLTMLDEVYKRYMQYYQQIQAVVSSFEYVSGLSNAAPYATLAIRAMFKHFKSLKNVITDQLHQFTNSNNKGYNFHNISNKINDAGGGQIIRATNQNQNPEFVGHQQPIWRPQRGLPERAVTVLRAWLFDHFLHPYPTDSDKIMLAKQTGLSRSQVSNWFINARVRVWKPMVEEIHMLETRQQQSQHQKNNNPDHHHQNQTHHHQIINNNITKEQNNKYYSTCDTKFEDSPFKRTRNIYNPPPPPNNNNNNNNDNINNLGAVANNGVSLTLGLHQNNGGLALPEPSFPIEAHRFGLHSDHQGFVVTASQDSHIESSLWKRNLL